jgi:4-amino-4-deoxy-L-arabinose transferase-like glycosyltransferase
VTAADPVPLANSSSPTVSAETAAPAAGVVRLGRRPRHRRVPSWAGWAVALCTFAAVAPMLPRFEFSNGIEELYAATVMEMNRGGPWVIPTLYGRPRIAKPPLPAWAGGLAVSAGTMAGIASPDPAVRAAAFARLAWEVRWPALLAGCLMVVATFDLGRSVGGRRAGLAAAVVAATSFLFLRYARLATADVYLGLFVAAANAMAARSLLRQQRWLGIVGTGAALGLGFMCKGPVCLVQTALPLAAWAGMVAWSRRARPARHLRSRDREGAGRSNGPVLAEGTTVDDRVAAPAIATAGPAGRPLVAARSTAPLPDGRGSLSASPERRLGYLLPSLLAAVVFLAIALPWPLTVLRSLNGAWNLWRREVTREGATDHEYGPVWSYLSLLPNLLPYLPVFVLGVGLTIRRWLPAARAVAAASGDGSRAAFLRPAAVGAAARAVAAHRGYLLALLLLLVPLVVMSLVRDKNERYLLPVLPAAAVLCGRGLLAVLAGVRRRRRVAVAAFDAQIGLVAALLVLLPTVGLTTVAVARVDGHPWFGRPLGLAALAAGVATTVALFWLVRRGRLAAAVGLAAAGMLAANALLLWGYKDDPSGRAEMRPIADDILARHPDPVVVYCDPQKPLPPDLPIYLNRVVRNVKPAAAAAATTQPAVGWPDGRVPDVVVMLQREAAPPPKLPGWRSFAREPYKKRYWHALERDPAAR